MTGESVTIKPLSTADHSAWLPLWRGYQAYYEVDIAPDVSAVTWSRLIDPAEPMGGALAWSGATAVGLVHHIRHRSCWTVGDYCYLQDLFVAQSSEPDLGKRRKIVWEIDRRLQEDLARPVIMHNRGGTCWTPKVRNMVIMANSVYNGWRFEDVWLEK